MGRPDQSKLLISEERQGKTQRTENALFASPLILRAWALSSSETSWKSSGISSLPFTEGDQESLVRLFLRPEGKGQLNSQLRLAMILGLDADQGGW
jgi:hypothetical protein